MENKILDNVCKEIDNIAEKGLDQGNLEILYKLVDIKKDLYEIRSKQQEECMRNYPMDYGARGGRGGYTGGRGSYDWSGSGSGTYGRMYDDRMYRYLDQIAEGTDDYQYGRDRYRDNGSRDRMEQGLDKLMYSLCTFVESINDFAETPEEKEIIRRHISKMKV